MLWLRPESEGLSKFPESKWVKEKGGVPLRDLDQKTNFPEGVSL
jgi:hypothetical protein